MTLGRRQRPWALGAEHTWAGGGHVGAKPAGAGGGWRRPCWGASFLSAGRPPLLHAPPPLGTASPSSHQQGPRGLVRGCRSWRQRRTTEFRTTMGSSTACCFQQASWTSAASKSPMWPIGDSPAPATEMKVVVLLLLHLFSEEEECACFHDPEEGFFSATGVASSTTLPSEAALSSAHPPMKL